MNKILRCFCILLVLTSLGARFSNAQDITKGSISGVVRDPSGAVVAGADVKLQSPYGDRSTKTGANGEYTFLNLVIGHGYNLSVEQPGFSKAEASDLSVSLNQTTTSNFTLQVGAASQTVAVTDSAVMIDTTSTTIGANLDESLYKNVPIGRNISSVMAMAPGVADSGGAGAANPSINGASGLENEYIVNGANTTDPGFGGFGTFSRVFGPLGNGINFDFVQEVQMQTGGFEAQYGTALGGVVNVITKSGSNQFHGDVFGYFQPQQFEATRTNANPLLVSKTDYLVHQASIDYGADAGGYIFKDKLFWYGGFNPLTNTSYKEADPSYANYALGVVDVKRKTYDYTAKLNYNLGSKHQFEGSVFGDPSHTPMQFNRAVSTVSAGDGVPVDLNKESKLEYGTRTWTARYTGALTSHWVATVNYSNYYNSFTETPKADGYAITDNTPVQNKTGGSISYGGLGFIEGSESKVNQLAVSSSHIFSFFGGHNITLGYQFENDLYNDIQRYTGANFTLPDVPELKGAAGQTVYGAAFTRTFLHNDPTQQIVLKFTRGNYSNPAVVAETRYHSGYIQDTWSFGRFTLKPGLRFEQQSMIGNSQSYVFGHNWAPRIGVIYDPFNDRKTKIAATWGRFYEKIPLDISVREFSVETGLTGLLYADPGTGAQPNLAAANYIPGGSIAFQGAAGLTPIAGGTGAQYQDEVTGSFEHEFAHNLTFTGRFVYRNLRRILEDTSGVNVTQALAGVTQQYVIANPSAKLDIYQNSFPCTSGANCNTDIGYTNFANGTDDPLGSDGISDGFPNASRIYKSMELIVSKRFSNLQIYANYTLSKLFGNFQGSYRSDNGQQDPNISSLFDFTNSDGLLTGQTTPGVLPTDRRHQLKLFGNYQWRAFNFGVGWTPTSGTPITELNDHPDYENAGEIPVGARGALGRTDWVFPVNFHADYTWKFSERARLKFVADLFNLFNQQTVVRVNQNHELDGSPGTLDPDFLRPALNSFADPYQAPFNARLAVRFEF